MKTSRWFSRPNSFLSTLRITIAGSLLIGGMAMAFVAAKTSSLLSLGTSYRKTEAKPEARFTRSVAFTNRFQTLLSFGNGGEEGPGDGAAQEAYSNQAYPATWIAAAQQKAAANPAKAISKLPGGKATNWQEVGPSGVPASALVASESTGATAGTIYSGRTTAIAVAPNCTAKKGCATFIGAAYGGVWQADNAL